VGSQVEPPLDGRDRLLLADWSRSRWCLSPAITRSSANAHQ